MAPPPENSPPWAKSSGLDAVLAEWLSSNTVRPCLSANRHLDGQSAVFAPFPPLDARIVAALGRRGVSQLYQHQVEAIQHAQAGRDVVIATPTASGKSLCFHLPVLDALAKKPGATALFLYPTKALSRDQEHGLGKLIEEAELGVPAVVFDGDTPGDARRGARERGRIILTNPDMLHSGILPNHTKWASFFSGLTYIVLDELHTYRGVFGSHMAHVIARLRRIAEFHGARPVVIGATATIGNPREHAARIFGSSEGNLALVDRSTAPTAPREVFIYNPPVVNAELGIRQSSLKAAVRLTGDLVERKISTILFAPSRNSVEVMLKYLRDRLRSQLKGSGPSVERTIMGYRGGYLPEVRRDIERGLRSGEILAVVATNALELGIDIGELDAVVCAGYPGTVAGTWQRFGRAGRRGVRSCAVLVCNSGAVDQFMAREPQFLLDRPSEEALIDPENPEIVLQHLKCAAFEAPFDLSPPRLGAPTEAANTTAAGYGMLDAATTRDALEYLAGHGLLHVSGQRYHWAGDAFPATHVSLRSVGWDNFVIVDVGTPDDPTPRTIGELDYRATHTMLHEQAIYQQDAEQYQVEKLDFDNHKAFVRRVEPDYFTTALTYRTVSVLDTREAKAAGNGQIGLGDIKVIEKVTGYKKIKFFSHENAGYGDVHLPEMEKHTTSFWLTVPEPVIARLIELHPEIGRPDWIDALGGIGLALETVCSIGLMCDPRDIQRTLGDGATDGLPPGRDYQQGRTGSEEPTLFLFDSAPGGVGLAARIWRHAEEWIPRAGALIAECPCGAGCPACLGPSESGNRKERALALLAALGLSEPPLLH